MQYVWDTGYETESLVEKWISHSVFVPELFHA